MLCQNVIVVLADRKGSGWTLSWLGHGCFASLDGRYHGWDMDALAERMGSWMLWQNGKGLGGRCRGWDMDGLPVWVDVIMVGTWMLCQNEWGLGRGSHGWDMDALAERMGSGWMLSWLGHGCSGRTDGVWVDVIIVGTWMLSGRTDGVWADVIMVGTWMLWQNQKGPGGHCHGCDMDALPERRGLGGRYHGWDMDALAKRMGSG